MKLAVRTSWSVIFLFLLPNVSALANSGSKISSIASDTSVGFTRFYVELDRAEQPFYRQTLQPIVNVFPLSLPELQRFSAEVNTIGNQNMRCSPFDLDGDRFYTLADHLYWANIESLSELLNAWDQLIEDIAENKQIGHFTYGPYRGWNESGNRRIPNRSSDLDQRSAFWEATFSLFDLFDRLDQEEASDIEENDSIRRILRLPSMSARFWHPILQLVYGIRLDLYDTLLTLLNGRRLEELEYNERIIADALQNESTRLEQMGSNLLGLLLIGELVQPDSSLWAVYKKQQVLHRFFHLVSAAPPDRTVLDLSKLNGHPDSWLDLLLEDQQQYNETLLSQQNEFEDLRIKLTPLAIAAAHESPEYSHIDFSQPTIERLVNRVNPDTGREETVVLNLSPEEYLLGGPLEEIQKIDGQPLMARAAGPWQYAVADGFHFGNYLSQTDITLRQIGRVLSQSSSTVDSLSKLSENRRRIVGLYQAFFRFEKQRSTPRNVAEFQRHYNWLFGGENLAGDVREDGERTSFLDEFFSTVDTPEQFTPESKQDESIAWFNQRVLDTPSSPWPQPMFRKILHQWLAPESHSDTENALMALLALEQPIDLCAFQPNDNDESLYSVVAAVIRQFFGPIRDQFEEVVKRNVQTSSTEALQLSHPDIGLGSFLYSDPTALRGGFADRLKQKGLILSERQIKFLHRAEDLPLEQGFLSWPIERVVAAFLDKVGPKPLPRPNNMLGRIRGHVVDNNGPFWLGISDGEFNVAMNLCLEQVQREFAIELPQGRRRLGLHDILGEDGLLIAALEKLPTVVTDPKIQQLLTQEVAHQRAEGVVNEVKMAFGLSPEIEMFLQIEEFVRLLGPYLDLNANRVYFDNQDEGIVSTMQRVTSAVYPEF